jgi:hypothetical protein
MSVYLDICSVVRIVILDYSLQPLLVVYVNNSLQTRGCETLHIYSICTITIFRMLANNFIHSWP